MGHNGQDNVLREGNCSSSVERVPQTPLLESNSTWLSEANEDTLLVEEDLVGTQISWNVGKTLGLKVNNEEALTAALAKVDECQDFVLPRKRGRPRKNKGLSKV